MAMDRYYRSRTRTSAVGTVIGIALVLFMLGILGYLMLNARAVEHWVKENLRVEIFLKHDARETDVMKFRKELDTQPFTRETRYVTADEAAERLKADLGEDFLGVLGANPLLPSIELNLNADHAHPDSLAWITGWIQKDPRVEEVKYNKDVVSNITSNMRKLGLLLLGFATLLLVIAVALINNTIRLAIYSRRFLIRTMHLTGATQWFIKKPFLGQSLWHGLVASVLAIGLLTATVRLITHFVPDLRELIDPLMLARLFLGTVLLGLLISLVSTWFAVRRYLRMNIDELNWS